jgi:hypothetical protein
MSEPFDPNAGPPLLGSSPIHDPEGQPEQTPPAKKSPMKSWVAAGIVAAAFAGGAILAVTLTGHHGGSSDNAVRISSTDNGGNASGNDPNGSQNGGANGGQFARRFAGRGAAGTITAIDGKTLTLETRDFSGDTGTTKVVTTDDTKFTEMVDGKVSDIKVGDNVLVTTDDTTGAASVTATNIVDNGDQQAGFFRQRSGAAPDGQAPPDGQVPPDGQNGTGPGFRNFGNGGFRAGEVTSVDGSTITIKTVQGDTVTVATNADTKISVTKEISLKDLKVGDTVRAEGTTNDGTVTADSVRKGELGGFRGAFPGGRGPGNGGQFGPPSSSSTD